MADVIVIGTQFADNAGGVAIGDFLFQAGEGGVDLAGAVADVQQPEQGDQEEDGDGDEEVAAHAMSFRSRGVVSSAGSVRNCMNCEIGQQAPPFQQTQARR